MEIRDLVLSATAQSWKIPSNHCSEMDKAYKSSKGNGKKFELFNSIWERDKHKCYFCNFESKRFQEIHHLNDNHNDFSKDNLVTICPLCHLSFHLDTLTGGKIIWLPEFTQQELNYLCRALFIAQEDLDAKESKNAEPLKFTKMASMIEDALANRALIVEKEFQSGSSDPSTFAGAILNMTPEQYEKRYSLLRPFKVLPNRAKFPKQINYWKNNTFSDLPVETWEKLIIKQS